METFYSIRVIIGLQLLLSLLAFTGADGALAGSSRIHGIHRRSADIGAKVGNRTLKIVTILAQPYTIKTPIGTDGQFEYTGFIPELIFELSRRLHFQYTFYESPDGKFGSIDASTGKWTGMIGECVKNEEDRTQGADIAAAPITVSSRREKVVDFIKPFQHLGLTVVIKAPSNIAQYPNTFGIFQPFDHAVWGLVLFLTIVVGLFLWLMNLYNPYEWAGRHSIGLAEQYQSETFNLAGSMWFVFTSLQWQGFERSPRSIASRLLCCIWFLFVTILVVTYTAGVVNNLFWASMFHSNSQTKAQKFADLGELVSSKEFDVGAVAAGSTYEYITAVAEGEEFDVIRSAWQAPGGKDLLATSATDGVARARASRYAFIMESATATYIMNQRPCDLQTIGDVFAKRSYGFTVPNNSLILEELHVGILEMMEEGEMEALEQKWFVGTGQCWNATKRGDGGTASGGKTAPMYVDQPKRIDLSMFWGALVLLLVGLVVSSLVGGGEIVYYRQWGKYNTSNQPRDRELKMDAE